MTDLERPRPYPLDEDWEPVADTPPVDAQPVELLPDLQPTALREALAAGLADALTIDWPGDTRLRAAPAIADYLLRLPEVKRALDAARAGDELDAADDLLAQLSVVGDEHADLAGRAYWRIRGLQAALHATATEEPKDAER